MRAFPGSQVMSPSSFNTSRWCHTVVVDLPTVLAISLTVVGWVLMTVLRTVIRDTERMLAGRVSCSRVGVWCRVTTADTEGSSKPFPQPGTYRSSFSNLDISFSYMMTKPFLD